MPRDYQVTSLLICEEIRFEANGKQMLIGVYNGTILVNSFPTVMPHFSIRIGMKVNKLTFKDAHVRVIDPARRTIINGTSTPKFESIEDEASISTSLSPFIFEIPGEYVVQLGMDGPPRKIGSFKVREAKAPAERLRVGGKPKKKKG